MALPLDQLTQTLTTDQVEQSILNLLAAAGLPVTSWQDGSVVKTIIRTVASIYAGFTDSMVAITNSGFLDLATDFWLTILAKYNYNVDRIQATFATGTLTLTNTGGGIYSNIPAGEFIVFDPIINKTYVNTDVFTLNPLSVVDIPIQASEPGASSTAQIGEINQLVTQLLGVTCSNAAPLIGTDAETDAALRQRCRDSLGALSPNGPSSAYDFAAKTSVRPDGTPIGVNRTKVSANSSTGQVQVYVSTASGPLTVTDLGYVNLNIQTNVVPVAVTCTVFNATPINVTITANVWANKTPQNSITTIQTNINNAMVSFFQNYPIGGLSTDGINFFLFKEKISAVIFNADPAIFDVVITNPLADVPLASSEVAVLFATPATNYTVTLV